MSDNTSTNSADPLGDLSKALGRFASERDWDQYHSPKNLTAALTVEVAELLEHFQWITEEQSQNLRAEELAKAREEMADVLLYLLRLASKLDIDLVRAAIEKIQLNARKYPIDRSRGSSKKYTDI